MAVSINPGYRAAAIGVAAAALLVGAFSVGASRGGASSGGGSAAQAATVTAARSSPGRITVTGVGTVTGTPNQLVLSMGVQVNGATVTSALGEANKGVRRVTAALRDRGMAAADIQTSGFTIWPNYEGSLQIPVSYGVSESLTATLTELNVAGGQIGAAVRAGGNAVTVDNVSLNLTDTGSLLAAARASAVKDAQAKAAQFARALGQPLGPVISVTPENESTPVEFGANATAAKAGPVPILPGTQQVTVSITVVYAT
jgi:uncharacterized protein